MSKVSLSVLSNGIMADHFYAHATKLLKLLLYLLYFVYFFYTGIFYRVKNVHQCQSLILSRFGRV